eukprot:jgi/Bigna1/142968/aug1.74_g17676
MVLCLKKILRVSATIASGSHGAGYDEPHGAHGTAYSRGSLQRCGPDVIGDGKECWAIEAQPRWFTISNFSLVNHLIVLRSISHGLPAGPFGLLGLLEGMAYLVILGFIVFSIRGKFSSGADGDGRQSQGSTGAFEAAKKLSYVTLAVSLIVFGSLFFEQGCIPNAKPILDYSSVLPVCPN